MSVTPIASPVFMNVLTDQLRNLSARHEVISHNITNVTTPGYKAVDVSFAQNFKELVGSHVAKKGKLPLAVTSAYHLNGSTALSSSVATVMQDDVEEKPNGNNVSLTGETLRMVQNQQKYDEALSVYNNANNLVKSVIGKDGG